MQGRPIAPTLIVFAVSLFAGCATRPINQPITHVEPDKGYRYVARQAKFRNKESLVILAFSGGGTRAAAFSYALEMQKAA